MTEKKKLLKMSVPQILLNLFTFRPIASKQLKSLLTIDTLSWLGAAVVTHPLWGQEDPGSIPSSGKDFYVWFLYNYVVVVFLLFVHKDIICHKKIANPFAIIINFVS